MAEFWNAEMVEDLATGKIKGPWSLPGPEDFEPFNRLLAEPSATVTCPVCGNPLVYVEPAGPQNARPATLPWESAVSEQAEGI